MTSPPRFSNFEKKQNDPTFFETPMRLLKRFANVNNKYFLLVTVIVLMGGGKSGFSCRT